MNCEHFATGIIAGQEVLCRLPFLRQYCVNTAKIYYVGIEDPPPESEALKILKQFKRFKYCPKCGQKLIFPAKSRFFFGEIQISP